MSTPAMPIPNDTTVFIPETVDPEIRLVHTRPIPKRMNEERVPVEEAASEEIKMTGDALVSKIKEWIHQGNIRRIILKNEEGHTLFEIPLTVGVIGTAIGATVSPEIVAVSVIGSMMAHLTVVIERQHSS